MTEVQIVESLMVQRKKDNAKGQMTKGQMTKGQMTKDKYTNRPNVKRSIDQTKGRTPNGLKGKCQRA